MSIPGGDELRAAVNQVESCWRVSNRYNAASACGICAGIIQHEGWCVEINPDVRYAFLVILQPHLMVQADHIALHGLGVTWNACERKCNGTIHTT